MEVHVCRVRYHKALLVKQHVPVVTANSKQRPIRTEYGRHYRQPTSTDDTDTDRFRHTTIWKWHSTTIRQAHAASWQWMTRRPKRMQKFPERRHQFVTGAAIMQATTSHRIKFATSSSSPPSSLLPGSQPMCFCPELSITLLSTNLRTTPNITRQRRCRGGQVSC